MAHRPDRTVESFSRCGKPATHRFTEHEHTWLSCQQHAQATWEILEDEDGATSREV